MHYICIENEQVISVLSYRPQVPNSVTTVEISDEDAKRLQERTHYYDMITATVKQY